MATAQAINDPSTIAGYHAHIYYDEASKPAAARLREAIEAAFPQARMGRWHDEPVGPHPISMYQVAFAVEQFPQIVPWLMLNRRGLTILAHPETGDDYTDHAENALWLGGKIKLRLETLRRRGQPRD
ncbi:MAG: DOPA 4,5-dioxygenase family protein [Candidatus Binataceae bacterium]